jgi:hypothetical protein
MIRSTPNARPGGNLTGFSDLNVELIPKRIELLCELVPKAAVIAQLIGPMPLSRPCPVRSVGQRRVEVAVRTHANPAV